MRHTPRRILPNVLLFSFALLLILYFNHHSPTTTSTTLSTKITYVSSSPSIHPPRGICPNLKDTTKPALIVARISSDDTSWLDTLSALYHLCVYTADAPQSPDMDYLQIPKNRGNEAMIYLTFLIDNYASLPRVMVFIHGSRYSWHNDHPLYDNLPLLTSLNTSTFSSSSLTSTRSSTGNRGAYGSGYSNLRCDWSAGVCPPHNLPQGSVETYTRALLEPWNTRAISDAALPRALTQIFGSSAKLDRRDAVRAGCCAQFIVHRENVLRHTLQEYVALRQWLLDTETASTMGKGPSRLDDRVAGRVLSYVWHILFLSEDGEVELDRLNEMACPSARDCYCRLYGRCELEGCSKGSCKGMYTLPVGMKLPDGWEREHGGLV